ncbi:hypothetical protein V8E51_016664 [Hyaloscypha variabilis]
MDPLSALGVAASIVQFIQFGSSITSQALEIYKSSEGSSADNFECENASKRLRELCNGLKNTGCYGVALKKICEGCLEVAEELETLLGKLRLNETAENGTLRKWRSFRQALKSIWSLDSIERLKRRLAAFGNELEIHLIMALREQANALTNEQRESFSAIQSLTRNLSNTRRLIRDDIFEQGQKFGVENSAGHEKTRTVLKALINDGEGKKMRAAFMRSLGYSEMQDRHRRIAEAHEQTFRWIFAKSKKEDIPWSPFTDWLQSGNGVYWINGKAGSGKSTLMRYVVENRITNDHLDIWSGTEALVTGAFFFWSSGTEEQRSYTGLLRTLLYDMLLQHPEFLFPVLSSMLESQWDDSLSEIQFEHHRWSLSELKRAFTLITDHSIVPMKFCFFIDGLDEYSGDHEEMGEFLKQVAMSPHVKFCLSSRPWIVFEDTFHGLPMLRLQDLTYGDIKAYVADKLERHPKMRDLSRKEPLHSAELISEIVSKASGVFLWVVLVVSNLLTGLRNRDDISDLRKRLRVLPAELEKLYKHMLGQVDQVYQERASRTFRIFRVLSGMNRKELMMSFFIDTAITSTYETAITTVVDPINPEEMQKRFNHLDWHLKSHCAGLIEISGLPQLGDCVSYLHRTVQDFVESGPLQTWIIGRTTDTDFEPNISILISLIIKIKQALSSYKFDKSLLRMVLADLQSIMNRANAAEYSGMLKKSMKYIELVDEADRVGTVFAQKYQQVQQYVTSNHWSDLSKNHGRHGAGFLAEAVSYGLRAYVTAKLKGDSTILLQSNINNLLLIHAVIPSYGRSDLESSISLEMIKVLIGHGANPNQIWKGQTAWQRYLTWIHEYGSSSDCLLSWFEICRVFLLCGASVNTTCVSNHKLPNGDTSSSHTVLDVIDDVFGKGGMHEQALELFRLVEKRRRSDYECTQSSNGPEILISQALGTNRKRKLDPSEFEFSRKRWKNTSSLAFPN